MHTVTRYKYPLFLLASAIMWWLIFGGRDAIHTEPAKAEYAGEWRAKHNRSSASVTVRGSEEYEIRYSSAACRMLLTGTIYTVDIAEQSYRILRLDIDREQSECYFLNNPFTPSHFVFKLEHLNARYAKLKLPSMSDIELFMANARGSDAVKSNLESMIRLLRMKSEMLSQMEKVVLEYEK